MREFSVDFKVRISESDYQDIQDDFSGWDLDSEVRSWLSDLGFEIVRCYVDEERG